MTEWTTIRIRKRTRSQAESDKDEDETWDEYLRRCNPETETETETNREFCDFEDLTINADNIKTETDTSKFRDLTIDKDELYGRIDDLETEIKMKIEQEIRR
jgi:hypothetical protein